MHIHGITHLGLLLVIHLNISRDRNLVGEPILAKISSLSTKSNRGNITKKDFFARNNCASTSIQIAIIEVEYLNSTMSFLQVENNKTM